MKVFVICSKAFYKDIPPIKEKLEQMGHEVAKFKERMFIKSRDTIESMDAVLTLNFEKHGQANYIGGATFLELYEAFMMHKKIFLYNDIPEGMLYDEISGFSPIIIHGDLDLVK